MPCIGGVGDAGLFGESRWFAGSGFRIDAADGDCLEVETEIEVRDAA